NLRYAERTHARQRRGNRGGRRPPPERPPLRGRRLGHAAVRQPAQHRLQLLGRGLRAHRPGHEGRPPRGARLRPRHRAPPGRDLPDRRTRADEVRPRDLLVLPRASGGREPDSQQGALQLPRLARRPARVLRHPQGRAAGARPGRSRGLDDRAAQRAVGHPHRHRRGRGRSRARQHREGEPARALDDGAGPRLRQGARRPRASAARPRVPVDRLRPLHARHQAGGAPARRALVVGGSGQQGVRPAPPAVVLTGAGDARRPGGFSRTARRAAAVLSVVSLRRYGVTIDEPALLNAGDRTLFALTHPHAPQALDFDAPDPPSSHSLFPRLPDPDDAKHYPVLPALLAAATDATLGRALALGTVDGHHLGLALLSIALLALYTLY